MCPSETMVSLISAIIDLCNGSFNSTLRNKHQWNPIFIQWIPEFYLQNRNNSFQAAMDYARAKKHYDIPAREKVGEQQEFMTQGRMKPL